MRYVFALVLLCAAGWVNAGLVTVNYSGVITWNKWDVGPELVNAGDMFYGSIIYDENAIWQCNNCVLGGFLQVGGAPLIVLPNSLASNPVSLNHDLNYESRVFFWEAGRGIWPDWYIEDWWLALGDARSWVDDTIHLGGIHDIEGLGTAFGFVGHITEMSRVVHGVPVPEPATGCVLLLGLVGAVVARGRWRSVAAPNDQPAV